MTFVIPGVREHVHRVRRQGRAARAHQAGHRGLEGLRRLPAAASSLGIIGAAWAARYFYRTPSGQALRPQDHPQAPRSWAPVLQKIAVARFTRTLGTLLSSGVPILDALDIVAKTAGNVIVEEGIMLRPRAASPRARTWRSRSLETNVFPGMVVQMVGVGEQTGALDTMLNKIADFYEEEVDVAVAALTLLIEPVLMVVIGGDGRRRAHRDVPAHLRPRRARSRRTDGGRHARSGSRAGGRRRAAPEPPRLADGAAPRRPDALPRSSPPRSTCAASRSSSFSSRASRS